MELSIVIVNWNAKNLLYKCLESIYKNRPSIEFEVIVVDNCSADNSVEMINNNFKKVILVQNKANYGFAKANNIGIKHSKGRYIAFINSDVEVLSGCFDRMFEFMEKNVKIGILGPLILNSDRSVQASCRRFPGLWRSFCEAICLNKIFKHFEFFSAERMIFFKHDLTKDVDVISGCFWLCRRNAIESVGSLDERFFIYLEDVDWCLRFWKAGWKVVFFPVAKAIHNSGGSSAIDPLRFSIEHFKATLQYWTKYKKRASIRMLCLILLLHYGLRFVGEMLRSFSAIGDGGNYNKDNHGTRYAMLKSVYRSVNCYLK